MNTKCGNTSVGLGSLCKMYYDSQYSKIYECSQCGEALGSSSFFKYVTNLLLKKGWCKYEPFNHCCYTFIFKDAKQSIMKANTMNVKQ